VAGISFPAFFLRFGMNLGKPSTSCIGGFFGVSAIPAGCCANYNPYFPSTLYSQLRFLDTWFLLPPSLHRGFDLDLRISPGNQEQVDARKQKAR
jgi:hypothetical protein